MPFNLRRQRSPLRRIRASCPDVRPSDLEGAGDDELERLASRVESITKKAIGPGGSLGPSWVEVDGPPMASPMVRALPIWGGGTLEKQRRDLPGGQDPLGGGKGKAKNYPVGGNFPDELNLDGEGASGTEDGFEWEVSFDLREWDDPDKVKKWLSGIGGDVESDGRRMVAVVGAYKDAISVQRRYPGTIISRRRRTS
jgi:hypothetical protein